MQKIPTLFFAFLSAVMLSCVESASAQSVNRHVEKAGGFSFVAPQGWTFRGVPGMKYAAACAPPGLAFTANINVVDETYVGSLQDYARANLKSIKSALKNFEVVGHAGFATDSGVQGAVLIGEDDLNGVRLRQSFFFFGNGDHKFVVTCTTAADDGAKSDALFRSSLKSFRFEN